MGATIAEMLRSCGLTGVLLDDPSPSNEPGTRACGGLIKPSPLSGLSSEQTNKSLAILDRFFGLHPETLIIRPSGNLIKANVQAVNMDHIFAVPRTPALVHRVHSGVLQYLDQKDRIVELESPLIVVAAGPGTLNLFPQLRSCLVVKRGFSFHMKGRVAQGFVKFWAPYKQVTVHNTRFEGEKIVWAGEGSALRLENWYRGRIREGLARVRKELPEKEYPLIRTVTGLRLFHHHRKPCFVEKMDKGLYVVTAAGKFGLISAGYAAMEVAKHERLA